MSLNDTYSLITKDRSGSISKNRFRQELLWGIKKIYDLYEIDKNEFFVVFDCACDIEVGKNGKITFYQLKTTTANFTIGSLTKSKGLNHSILSKLYSLYIDDYIESLYIVAQAKLSCADTKLSNSEIIKFSDLCVAEATIISTHIKEVLNVDPDLSKIFFCKSSFCIDKPDTLLLGETTNFLMKIFKVEEVRSRPFLDFLKSEIERKACYELETSNLEETIIHKGITREQFEIILKNYDNSTNKFSKEVYDKLDLFVNDLAYNEIVKAKKSFAIFLKKGFKSNYLDSIISNVIYYYCNNEEIKNKLYKDAIISITNNKSLYPGIIEFNDKLCLAVVALLINEKKEREIINENIDN